MKKILIRLSLSDNKRVTELHFIIQENMNIEIKWYSKASYQGDDESEYNIANLYNHQNKLGINTTTYYIAEAYNNGIGVPLNKDEAIKWYKTAAESIFD
ncbi:hypothetical protein N8310_00065 [Pseudomonadota bacterium]|nr:hypothetical protein [Pseudomonadota bacterium]